MRGSGMAGKPILRDRVRTMLISRAVAQKSLKPLPPLRNRGEARKHLRGRGPFMFFGAPKRVDNRQATTRQKRAEQRERAKGHADG